MRRTPGIRGYIGRYLRTWADRIDRLGAPKATHVSFTFEEGVGIMFRDDGRGCRLWYYGDTGYERAHAEGGPVVGATRTAWLPKRPAAGDPPLPSEQDLQRRRRDLLEYTDRNGQLSPRGREELAAMRAAAPR
jgi:hypothetical protein